ncbi:M23 family metallopeptidase [Actinomadura rugatobispora]|uniref:M23 family metallopeptidase n=1 Tax=Actinomadura rugatobispora TaxID=1994 RepID=A0ABW1AHN9_9ACTN
MTLLTLLLTFALPAWIPAQSDAWRWPLGPPAPQVVRTFSPPPQPWGPGHRGVDLAARPGQPVYAAGAGRVSYAGHLAGRGVVAITHGALRTTYLPVRPIVQAGHDVRAGSRIGTVEPSAHCPAPCLHWGLLRGHAYLDPINLVRPEVRLLPHWPTPSPQPETPRPTSSSTEMGLRDATTAGSGALAGMLFAFTLMSLWRHGRPRRPLPPGVIDLTRERRERRLRRAR